MLEAILELYNQINLKYIPLIQVLLFSQMLTKRLVHLRDHDQHSVF